MNLDLSAPTLNTLKQAARAEHLAIVDAGKGSLSRAMAAGDHLREIINLKLVGHGQKKMLFEETCDSVRTAQVYIQLAESRTLIEANTQSSALLSIDAALKFLRQYHGTSNPKEKEPKPIFTLAAWLALSEAERTKLLDDIGRERLCAAMSPALAAKIAEHILGQHNQLTGGRKKSAADKQIGALAARRTDNVIELPSRPH